MSISCLMVHWFEHLAKTGCLGQGGSYLELGPQELTTPRSVVTAVAKRLQGEERGLQLAEAIFHGNPHADFVLPERQYNKQFLSIFSIASYDSLDMMDEVADYRYDLNRHFPFFRTYDIVANFGTAEHVFRTGQVFEFCHRAVKPKGLMLHVLPAFGDINHGFFNIHPILYIKLVEQNGYELTDIEYIDDIALRSTRAAATPDEPFDFSTLPVKIGSSIGDEELKALVCSRFVENNRSRTGLTEPERNAPVFDYCFVAMRRLSTAKFVVPTQYGDTPPPPTFNAGSFLKNMGRLGRYRRRRFR